jgi:hypothetical protein
MYSIIRMYRDRDGSQVIREGLTLEEAQEHCRDPETTSSKCTLPANIRRTEKYGPWFDGYEET